MRDLLAQKEQAERNVSFYKEFMTINFLSFEVFMHHFEFIFVAETS